MPSVAPDSLQSKLFCNDGKLNACLRIDGAHIKMGATGEHVAKIQSALKQLSNANIESKELSTKTYGPTTANAVLQYKKDRAIINKSYQNRPDNIVGKMTIRSLDDEMKVKEDGFSYPPKSTPPTGLLIVPFNEAGPMLMAVAPHSTIKGDLNNKTSEPSFPNTVPGKLARLQLENTRKHSTGVPEGQMRQELELAGPAGLQLHHDFIQNTVPKRVIIYGVNSALAQMVAASNEFAAANKEVNTAISAALSESAMTGVLDYRVLREELKKVPPPLWGYSKMSPRLLIAIGYFQGSNLFLEDFEAQESTNSYKAKLIYEMFDHFGVGDSDLIFDGRGHGTKGQASLWVLQRERHPGHEPFVGKVVIEQVVEGNF